MGRGKSMRKISIRKQTVMWRLVSLINHVLNHGLSLGSAWADLLWLQCQQEKEIMITDKQGPGSDVVLLCLVILRHLSGRRAGMTGATVGLWFRTMSSSSFFWIQLWSFSPPGDGKRSIMRKRLFSDWSTSVQHSHHFPQENIVWWGWNYLARHKWDAWWICKLTEIN